MMNLFHFEFLQYQKATDFTVSGQENMEVQSPQWKAALIAMALFLDPWSTKPRSPGPLLFKALAKCCNGYRKINPNELYAVISHVYICDPVCIACVSTHVYNMCTSCRKVFKVLLHTGIQYCTLSVLNIIETQN